MLETCPFPPASPPGLQHLASFEVLQRTQRRQFSLITLNCVIMFSRSTLLMTSAQAALFVLRGPSLQHLVALSTPSDNPAEPGTCLPNLAFVVVTSCECSESKGKALVRHGHHLLGLYCLALHVTISLVFRAHDNFLLE